jgi:adenine deaminase
MTSTVAQHPLADFIRRLPKTETHLHIEGALPLHLLQKLDPERFAEPPEFWRDDFRYESFAHFEETLIGHAMLWFTSADRYHEAAAAVFQGLLRENCRYVETSFHLGMVEFAGIPGKEILHAIKSAAPQGLEVRVFAGMARDHYSPILASVIQQLHLWEELDGIDLHGPETLPTHAWKKPVWKRAREAGKVTKAHAGEFAGPGNVRFVIEELGVTRVQHGVNAVHDPAVVALAQERGVTFDVCPISNLKLQVVESMAKHPIRDLLAAGIRCTVSTDDPFSFGNRLSDEYHALAVHLRFTPAELAQVARNGFAVSSLPPETKEQCLREIDQVLDSCPPSIT